MMARLANDTKSCNKMLLTAEACFYLVSLFQIVQMISLKNGSYIRQYHSLFFQQGFFFAFLHLLSSLTLPVLMELFLYDSIGFVHIGTGKGGSDAAASFKRDEPVVVPTFEVAGHPVSPFGDVHAPKFAFPREVLHFYCFDFSVWYGLAVAEGEKVTLDNYLMICDSHIFVFIQSHHSCDSLIIIQIKVIRL